MVIDAQLARILDANANRAREGLRTAEDYVRFLLGDQNHAERLRVLRQALTDTLLSISGLEKTLIEARNVSSDPLQPENWKDMLRRLDAETPPDVARRGLKRAQEALRALEEFLRATHGPAAERISKLRYGAYEAEQWLMCAGPAMQILQAARVYVLLSAEFCKNKDIVETAKLVLKGGVKLLQIREKQQKDVDLLPILKTIDAMCIDAGAILFSNDRVDLALIAGANGVHLGQTDLRPQDARILAGRRLLIGRSTHSVDQARSAVDVEKADYIGIGAMFDTQTKSNPIVGGLKLAEEITALKLSVPVFAIGGITLERVKALKTAGVTRVAVTQAIVSSASPEVEARRFVEAMGV